MTTKTTTTKRAGIGNSADQDYTPAVVTTPLVSAETTVPVTTKRTRKVTTPVTKRTDAEIRADHDAVAGPEVTKRTATTKRTAGDVIAESKTAPKRTRSQVKTDAEVTADTQVATVAPKRTRKTAPAVVKLPDTATEVDTATYLAMTVMGKNGIPSVIASEVEGFSLPRVRASLLRLVGFGVVERVVETLTVGNRTREVDSYYLPGQTPKVTGPREITQEEITRTAKTVGKTSAPTPRKRAEVAPVTTTTRTPRATVQSAPKTPASSSKGRTTTTPEKTAQRPPRAPQTRPFEDGETRTHKVNGRVHVIGTPLNQDRPRHAPGGLKSEITTFLTENAGQWFTVGQIARAINNWEAQTGRTSARLVELGILEFSRESGRKTFRFPAPTQVKRSSRKR